MECRDAAAELERDIARLRLVIGQVKQIEEARRQRLEEQPERGRHAMVRLLARVVGIGIETADMLVPIPAREFRIGPEPSLGLDPERSDPQYERAR